MTLKNEQKNREKEFMCLYVAAQRRIYGLVMSLIVDWTDVDDIVQDAMLFMWENFDSYKTGTDFPAWALAITRNRIHEYHRKKGRNRRVFSPLTLDLISETASEDSHIEEVRKQSLRKCFKKLDPEQQLLLRLRYEDGATIKGIASRVNRSVHTLYKLFKKIHASLLKCVTRQMSEEGLI